MRVTTWPVRLRYGVLLAVVLAVVEPVVVAVDVTELAAEVETVVETEVVADDVAELVAVEVAVLVAVLAAVVLAVVLADDVAVLVAELEALELTVLEAVVVAEVVAEVVAVVVAEDVAVLVAELEALELAVLDTVLLTVVVGVVVTVLVAEVVGVVGDSDGDKVGADDEGDAVGITVGDSVYWAHAPGVVSSNRADSSGSVIQSRPFAFTDRHRFESLSHPQAGEHPNVTTILASSMVPNAMSISKSARTPLTRLTVMTSFSEYLSLVHDPWSSSSPRKRIRVSDHSLTKWMLSVHREPHVEIVYVPVRGGKKVYEALPLVEFQTEAMGVLHCTSIGGSPHCSPCRQAGTVAGPRGVPSVSSPEASPEVSPEASPEAASSLYCPHWSGRHCRGQRCSPFSVAQYGMRTLERAMAASQTSSESSWVHRRS